MWIGMDTLVRPKATNEWCTLWSFPDDDYINKKTQDFIRGDIPRGEHFIGKIESEMSYGETSVNLIITRADDNFMKQKIRIRLRFDKRTKDYKSIVADYLMFLIDEFAVDFPAEQLSLYISNEQREQKIEELIDELFNRLTMESFIELALKIGMKGEE